ncbi:MAG TPA: hypothetical protein VNX68_13975, partial [Nitrosopumilaceae archaeon]|nr:hypothetical protein [Nitrosopumilaceae archaeon]
YLSESINYTTDTIDLKSCGLISFKLPFYAFNKLQDGNHRLEIRISQEMFCSPSPVYKMVLDSGRKGSTLRSMRYFSKLPLIKADAAFELKVPAIYKAQLINEIIELRDDSTYSPSRMDNTIWNSSYPDIYWTVDYPLANLFSRSPYQKSTAKYTLHDTSSIYYYNPNDSLKLGIWDHDNLSSDDFIGQTKISFIQLKPGKTTRFSFGNIRRFELKMVPQGIINMAGQ